MTHYKLFGDNLAEQTGKCNCGGEPPEETHEWHCGWDLIGPIGEIVAAFDARHAPSPAPVSVPTDDLRKQVNDLGALAKALFEAQFARSDGGRMPADPTWDELDPSERDEFWEQARNARHVFGPRLAEIERLRALHHTPYVDEEHQGGNCVDVLMEQAAENARLRAQLATAHDGLTGLHREADGLAAENDRQHVVIEQLRAEQARSWRPVPAEDSSERTCRCALCGFPDATLNHCPNCGDSDPWPWIATAGSPVPAEAGDNEGCGGPGCVSFGGCAVCGPEAAMEEALAAEAGDSTADETPLAPVSYDQHESAMTEVMEERDNAIDWADRLADALAPAEVVGEHSSANDPWANALEHAESRPVPAEAEVDPNPEWLADGDVFGTGVEAGDMPALPPFVLRPALRDPETTNEADEDGEPLPGTDMVGWSMTSGCRVNFAQHEGGYLFHLSLFGDVLKRGVEQTTVTAEQVRDFATKLLALLPAEAVRDTAETAWTPKPGDRVRSKINGLYGVVKHLEPINQVVVTIEDGEPFEEGCWSIRDVEPAPAETELRTAERAAARRFVGDTESRQA